MVTVRRRCRACFTHGDSQEARDPVQKLAVPCIEPAVPLHQRNPAALGAVIVDERGETVRERFSIKMVFGGTYIKKILVCAVTSHKTDTVNGAAAIFHKMCPFLVHIDLLILLAVCKNIAVGVKQNHGIVKTVPALIQDLLVVALFGSGGNRGIPVLIKIKDTLYDFKRLIKLDIL